MNDSSTGPTIIYDKEHRIYGTTGPSTGLSDALHESNVLIRPLHSELMAELLYRGASDARIERVLENVREWHDDLAIYLMLRLKGQSEAACAIALDADRATLWRWRQQPAVREVEGLIAAWEYAPDKNPKYWKL